MGRCLILILLALCGSIAAAQQVPAGVYRGMTGQGEPMEIIVGDSGRIAKYRVEALCEGAQIVTERSSDPGCEVGSDGAYVCDTLDSCDSLSQGSVSLQLTGRFTDGVASGRFNLRRKRLMIDVVNVGGVDAGCCSVGVNYSIVRQPDGAGQLFDDSFETNQ